MQQKTFISIIRLIFFLSPTKKQMDVQDGMPSLFNWGKNICTKCRRASSPRATYNIRLTPSDSTGPHIARSPSICAYQAPMLPALCHRRSIDQVRAALKRDPRYFWVEGSSFFVLVFGFAEQQTKSHA